MTRIDVGCTFLQRELQANGGVVAHLELNTVTAPPVVRMTRWLGWYDPEGLRIRSAIGFWGRKQASNIRAVSAASRSFPNAAPSLVKGRDHREEGCRPKTCQQEVTRNLDARSTGNLVNSSCFLFTNLFTNDLTCRHVAAH